MLLLGTLPADVAVCPAVPRPPELAEVTGTDEVLYIGSRGEAECLD